MKKIFRFMGSMKFGMILLGLIMVISLVGTVITQGQSEDYYLANDTVGQLILILGLDNVYYTPYFLGLGAALIINLTLCSLIRFSGLLGIGKRRVEAALSVADGTHVNIAQQKKLESYLEKKYYRKKTDGAVTVYYKNQIGHAGSFLVHLSLVLLLLIGAVILYTGKSELYEIGYDTPITLEDGTAVGLVDFITHDENGELHYESTLAITTPDGQTHVDKTSVNDPINFDGKKYFQETYGFAARLQIWNTVTNVGDEICLNEPLFLQTSDSGAGLYYMTAYTDYVEDENGQVEILSEEIRAGEPAVFLVYTTNGTEEGIQTGMVVEGTTLQIEDIQFTFEELEAYPGIRIKETNRIAMGMLYGTFGMMIIGLWFCFFQQPVYITVGKRGYYHISGVRNTEGLENELQMYIEK